ncbi:MAG: alkaline phosphatase, partial [Bacteroidia bacterium]|nr:alkaline phosphatase [Bacteroidia bacterium]
MKKFHLLLAIAALLVSGCCNQKQESVKNVIYLIGDGMGFGAVSALLLTEDSLTGFEAAPVIGLNETCSANNYVTDSPAGGTALATGTRTNNGYLGVNPNGEQLTSILKKAQAMGKKSGIVVNTTLTEATPASFYAGVKKRSESFKIAEQFCQSNVDVAIGSGLTAFINRPDSVDMTAVLIEKGYDVYLDWKSVLASDSKKFVGILPMGDVHRRNTTSKTASAADGAEVCLAAKLAAEAGESADTTTLSE